MQRRPVANPANACLDRLLNDAEGLERPKPQG